MRKRCEKCGKDFEAREAYFKFCPNCVPSYSQKTFDLSALLLKGYFNQNGNPLKEVYLDVPKKLADIFSGGRRPLAIKQVRDFHRKISKAKIRALLRGIDAARSLLYECERDLEYQFKRDVVPESFVQFMKHHLALAEKDEKSLEGFFKHLDSIVCYYPLKK